MARRRPLTFKAWALGILGAIITTLVLYQARIAIIENMGQRQIERAEAMQQRLQQQARQTAQPTQPAPDPYAEQVAKAAAEAQRRHDNAWQNYYQPPKGCDVWRSDTHMVECVNHKMRAKAEFERKWAAGEIGTPQG